MFELVVVLLVIAGAPVVYCAPTIVAALRNHTELRRIAMFNILMGWTIIGWGVALALSFSKEGREIPVKRPAAWHRDPHDPTKYRYHNGIEWTDYQAPCLSNEPPPLPPLAPPDAPVSNAKSPFMAH